MSNAKQKLDRAVKLMELGRFAQARSMLQDGLGQFSDNGILFRLLAVCFVSENRLPEALTAAQKSIAILPEDTRSLYVLALVYDAMDEKEHAIHTLDQALSTEPNHEPSLMLLAKIYASMEIFGKSIDYLDRLLSIAPTNQQALALKSLIAQQTNNQNEADGLLDQALGQGEAMAGLFLMRAAQAEAKGDYATAAHIYQSVLAEHPEDWQLRDQVLDMELAKRFPIYRWLVLKFRAFNSVNYMALAFVLFLVLFGSLMARPQNLDKPYYPTIILILKGLSIYAFSFWGTKLLGHLYMGQRLWKLKFKDHFQLPTFLQASACLSLIAFWVHLSTHDFLWFGTSFMIILLALFALGMVAIDDEESKKIYRWYLFACYGVAFVNFVLQYIDHPLSASSSLWMLGVILLPLVGLVVWKEIKSVGKKKNSPKFKEKNLLDESKRSIQWIYWVMLPIVFGLIILGNIYAVNIISAMKFVIIWGVLALIFSSAITFLVYKSKPELFNLVSRTTSSEDIKSQVFFIWFLPFLFTFLVGIVGTAFCHFGEAERTVVAITKHGMDLKKTRGHIWVNYQGEELEIRLSRETLLTTAINDSVELVVRRSFFGIKYVDEILKK